MGWRIELSGDARKQLQKLGRPEAKRIVQFLHQRVEPLDDPRQLGIRKPVSSFAGTVRRSRGASTSVLVITATIVLPGSL